MSCKKNVYIDVTSFFHAGFMSGIQRVVREVTIRLVKMPELKTVLFTWSKSEQTLTVLNNDDFVNCYDAGSIDKNDIRILKSILLSDIKEGDVFFDLDSTWDPLCHNRFDFAGELVSRGVLIVTYVYDVLPIMHPEFWPVPMPRFYEYFAANLRYASLIVTSTKETVRRINILAKKVGSYAPPCVVSWLGSDFKVCKGIEKISEKALEIASLGKYILVVGTIEPRKNHKIVLDSYDGELSKCGLNLVFAGRRGWGCNSVLDRIDNHPKNGNGLFFLENENDATINFLYKNAFAVVFSTQDEGFGLPLVEALLNGAVTVVSDIPVMREVGGTACAYFNQNDASSLENVMTSFLNNSTLYESYKNHAKEYKPVVWDDVVKKIRDALLSVCNKK